MNVATGGRKPSTSNPLGNKLMSHHEDTTTQWRRSTVTEIEEAIDLTWKDPFYDDQPDIIAVFDFPDEDQVAAWVWRESRISAVFVWCFSSIAFIPYFLADDKGEGEERNPEVLLYIGTALIVGELMYLVKCYYDYYSCQRAAKEKWQHVAVTTQGVQMDDTGRNLSLRIPFENIQSVEIGNLKFHFHMSEFPRSCPFPVVQLACDRLPSERTLWSTLNCLNHTIWYATNIEKQKEFIDLVNTMKKRENTHPKEGLC